MKKWNTPIVEEVAVQETAGGIWKVGLEGPFNILLGKTPCQPQPPIEELPEEVESGDRTDSTTSDVDSLS